MKRKVQAQRKFAQGAPIASNNVSNSERSNEVTNSTPNREERRNVIRNGKAVKSLLDIVSFNSIHKHKKPVVLLERLNTSLSNAYLINQRTDHFEGRNDKRKYAIDNISNHSNRTSMRLRSHNKKSQDDKPLDHIESRVSLHNVTRKPVQYGVKTIERMSERLKIMNKRNSKDANNDFAKRASCRRRASMDDDKPLAQYVTRKKQTSSVKSRYQGNICNKKENKTVKGKYILKFPMKMLREAAEAKNLLKESKRYANLIHHKSSCHDEEIQPAQLKKNRKESSPAISKKRKIDENLDLKGTSNLPQPSTSKQQKKKILPHSSKENRDLDTIETSGNISPVVSTTINSEAETSTTLPCSIAKYCDFTTIIKAPKRLILKRCTTCTNCIRMKKYINLRDLVEIANTNRNLAPVHVSDSDFNSDSPIVTENEISSLSAAVWELWYALYFDTLDDSSIYVLKIKYFFNKIQANHPPAMVCSLTLKSIVNENLLIEKQYTKDVMQYLNANFNIKINESLMFKTKDERIYSMGKQIHVDLEDSTDIEDKKYRNDIFIVTILGEAIPEDENIVDRHETIISQESKILPISMIRPHTFEVKALAHRTDELDSLLESPPASTCPINDNQSNDNQLNDNQLNDNQLNDNQLNATELSSSRSSMTVQENEMSAFDTENKVTLNNTYHNVNFSVYIEEDDSYDVDEVIAANKEEEAWAIKTRLYASTLETDSPSHTDDSGTKTSSVEDTEQTNSTRSMNENENDNPTNSLLKSDPEDMSQSHSPTFEDNNSPSENENDNPTNSLLKSDPEDMSHSHSPTFDDNNSPSENENDNPTNSLLKSDPEDMSQSHSPTFEDNNSPSENENDNPTNSLLKSDPEDMSPSHSPTFDDNNSPSENENDNPITYLLKSDPEDISSSYSLVFGEDVPPLVLPVVDANKTPSYSPTSDNNISPLGSPVADDNKTPSYSRRCNFVYEDDDDETPSSYSRRFNFKDKDTDDDEDKTPSYSPAGDGKRTPSYSPAGDGIGKPLYSRHRDGKRTPSYSPAGDGIGKPLYSPARDGKRTPSYSPAGDGIGKPLYSPARDGKRTPTYSPAGDGIGKPLYSPARDGKRTSTYSPAEPLFGEDCDAVDMTPSYSRIFHDADDDTPPSYSPIRDDATPPSYSPVRDDEVFPCNYHPRDDELYEPPITDEDRERDYINSEQRWKWPTVNAYATTTSDLPDPSVPSCSGLQKSFTKKISRSSYTPLSTDSSDSSGDKVTKRDAILQAEIKNYTKQRELNNKSKARKDKEQSVISCSSNSVISLCSSTCSNNAEVIDSPCIISMVRSEAVPDYSQPSTSKETQPNYISDYESKQKAITNLQLIQKNSYIQAPVFTPTAEQFKDPVAYIKSVMSYANKFGICKVVPPKSFTPTCALDDEMRFNVTNQYVTRLFKRWGPGSKEMSTIKAYLASQSVVFKRAPLYEGLEANLPKLYQIVQRHGGLKEVIERKRWGRVAEEMRYTKGRNPEKKLDQFYVKYLLPYDTLSADEREQIKSRVERAWCIKYRKMMERAFKPLHWQKKMLGESESSEDEECSDDDEHINRAIAEAEECVMQGRKMSLKTFKKIASTAKEVFFSNSTATTPAEVEEEYWRLVYLASEHLCVISASIDTGTDGYGFTNNKKEKYGVHPWNLKNLAKNPGNILSYLGAVLGVTVPTLHLEMVFSTSCWHRDPHGLPWIEFMHSGPTKIWYGISDEQTPEFREAVETLCPSSCQNKSIWLPSDIAMIPPHLLYDCDVLLSRVEQNPGEYVIVVPKAYSCSISTGYTVSESVYFASNYWLQDSLQFFEEAQTSSEPTMISIESLLIAIVRDTKTPQNVLRPALSMINSLLEAELCHRLALEDELPASIARTAVKIQKHPRGPWYVREQDECEICRKSLFLSRVRGLTENNSSLCLEHAVCIIKKKNNDNEPTPCFKLDYYLNAAEIKYIMKIGKERLMN